MLAHKLFSSVLIAVWLSAGVTSMSHAIEEPKFTLVAQLGDVEIRTYEPTIQAYTTLGDDRAMNGGFRQLAGYIFGGNDSSAEIAMTAPVATTMGSATPEMAFTMPSSWDMDTLPAPESGSVALREVPGFTAAVIRFSGWATEGRAAKYKHKLHQLVDEQGLEVMGSPVLNQYNPPWTLPFLRRNEIMVRVRWSGDVASSD